jgi:hypothetical protein
MSTKKLLRSSDVVYAIGGSAKALQQWLDRRLIETETGYGGAWTSFTLRDVAVLAVTRALVDMNFPVREAFKFGEFAIAFGYKKRFPVRSGERFWAGWRSILMTVERTDAGWEVTLWRRGQAIPPSGKFVVVDVPVIVERAITRALERMEGEQGKPDLLRRAAKV